MDRPYANSLGIAAFQYKQGAKALVNTVHIKDWPSWLKWVKQGLYFSFTLAVVLQTVVGPIMQFEDQIFLGIPMAHPNWRELANPSMWAWIVGSALIAFGIHGCGMRIAMGWFRRQSRSALAAFRWDVRAQKRARSSEYKWKVMLYFDKYVFAPTGEELFFRWIPLFYALTPNHMVWLVAGGVIWPALHYDQVKPRTFWLRCTMLFPVGGLYLLPMLVVYFDTHNVISAFLASVLTHFLHNTFSAFARYEDWYLGMPRRGLRRRQTSNGQRPASIPG